MTKRLSKLDRAKRKTIRKWMKIKKLAAAGKTEGLFFLADNDSTCGFCNEYRADTIFSIDSCNACPLFQQGLTCWQWPVWRKAVCCSISAYWWIRLADTVIRRAEKAVE